MSEGSSLEARLSSADASQRRLALVEIMVRAAAAGKGEERDRLVQLGKALERDDADPRLRRLASDGLAEIGELAAKPCDLNRLSVRTVRPWHTVILAALSLVLMPASLIALFGLFAIAWSYLLPGTVVFLDRFANPPARDAVAAFSVPHRSLLILMIASTLGPALVSAVLRQLAVRRRGLLLGTGMQRIWTWNDSALSNALTELIERVQQEVNLRRRLPQRGPLRRGLRALMIYFGIPLAVLIVLGGMGAAVVVYWQFRYVEAVAVTTRQIESSSASRLDLSEALLCRGLAWHRTGRSDLARLDYDRALAIDANQANVLLARADAWYSGQWAQLGKNEALEKAIGDATRAIAIDPLLFEAYFDRAAYRLSLGDRKGAGEDLTSMREVLKRIETENVMPKLDVSKVLKRLQGKVSRQKINPTGARVPSTCFLAERPSDWFGRSLWDLASLIDR